MAGKKFRPIPIKLAHPEELPIDPKLVGRTVFLQQGFETHYDLIVGDLDPACALDPSIKPLWHDVEPADGVYVFELATVLPYYLPLIGSVGECFVSLDDHDLFLCNRMYRCFVGEGYPADGGLRFFLTHQNGLPSVAEAHGKTGLHPIPLKTFVSRAFKVKAETAEAGVSEGLHRWQEELVRDVVRLVEAMRDSGGSGAKRLLPFATPASLPLFWLVVEGRERARKIAQIPGDVALASLKAGEKLTEVQEEVFFAKIKADGTSPAAHQSALSLARSFLHYGMLAPALVNVCTACEIVLARYYHEFLLSRGASNKRLKEAEKDVTFSQLLNLHLFAMRDLSTLDDGSAVLGTLNRSRKLRNEIVHTGMVVGVTKAVVVESVNAAERLIEFLLKAPDEGADG